MTTIPTTQEIISIMKSGHNCYEHNSKILSRFAAEMLQYIGDGDAICISIEGEFLTNDLCDSAFDYRGQDRFIFCPDTNQLVLHEGRKKYIQAIS